MHPYHETQLRDVVSLAKKVRAAFAETHGGDLGGLCARASTQLHLAAKRAGMSGVDICVARGHVYCMFGDHVIDITATQFGVEDEVFVSQILDLKETVNRGGTTKHHSWEQIFRFHDLAEGYETVRRIGGWANWWVYDDKLIKEDMECVVKHTGELVSRAVDTGRSKVPESVIKLAGQVRAAFEEIVGREPYGSQSLGGWCFVASSHLSLAAHRLNINRLDICRGVGHVYCMFNEHIVDVTATQFGVSDKVFVVPLFELESKLEELGLAYKSNYWTQIERRIEPAQIRPDYLKIVKRHTGEIPAVTTIEATT